MAKSHDDRLKAAKARLAAAEAFVKAVKLEEAGDLESAHCSAQRAVLATKESLKQRHPWKAREQQLEEILRGGDEARDRVQQYLGWNKAQVGTIELRSDSARDGAKGATSRSSTASRKSTREIALPKERVRGAQRLEASQSQPFGTFEDQSAPVRV